MKKVILLLYVLVSIVDLWAIYSENRPLIFIAKSLIMPVLAGYYYYSSKTRNTAVILALSFSFLGDVLLLQDAQDYFIMGIGSFLTAQLCYIYIFWSETRKIYWSKSWPFLLFYLGLMGFLGPDLGDFLIPMGVYGAVLSFMGITALSMYVKTKNWLFLVGALLFIISDSSIAFSMFVWPELNMGLWIMGTYIIAQFCLIKAILSYELETEKSK
ncbi:lysoplasmalogenase [Flavobacteriaceae bacterium]|nr:lysoplasmalogenase [Flavobacteriaceae bacterium]